jgi:TetR/AcrR family fatty acid metabolism transcriptional regulator
VPENESPFSEPATREADARERRLKRPREAAAKDRTTKQNRLERTADKRERILKAAIKVFARKGFYAARVSEIAKAAGVADGTIYLYFRNKDDVLTSVFESRITRLVEVLREIVGAGGSFEDRFRRIVELQLGVLEGRRELAEVVTVNLRQSSKLLKQFAAPFFVQYLEVMAGLVAEAQQAGVVRADVSPRVVARAVWGALDGIALTWAIGGGEPGQLARAAPQVASVFLQGLLARPAAEGTRLPPLGNDDA